MNMYEHCSACLGILVRSCMAGTLSDGLCLMTVYMTCITPAVKQALLVLAVG